MSLFEELSKRFRATASPKIIAERGAGQPRDEKEGAAYPYSRMIALRVDEIYVFNKRFVESKNWLQDTKDLYFTPKGLVENKDFVVMPMHSEDPCGLEYRFSFRNKKVCEEFDVYCQEISYDDLPQFFMRVNPVLKEVYLDAFMSFLCAHVEASRWRFVGSSPDTLICFFTRSEDCEKVAEAFRAGEFSKFITHYPCGFVPTGPKASLN